MAEVQIIAETRLMPGMRDEVMPMLCKLVEGSRAEPGNVSYEVMLDNEDPDHLFFVETWASEEAVEKHNASPHFRAFAEGMTGRRKENRVTKLAKLF